MQGNSKAHRLHLLIVTMLQSMANLICESLFEHLWTSLNCILRTWEITISNAKSTSLQQHSIPKKQRLNWLQGILSRAFQNAEAIVQRQWKGMPIKKHFGKTSAPLMWKVWTRFCYAPITKAVCSGRVFTPSLSPYSPPSLWAAFEHWGLSFCAWQPKEQEMVPNWKTIAHSLSPSTWQSTLAATLILLRWYTW